MSPELSVVMLVTRLPIRPPKRIYSRLLTLERWMPSNCCRSTVVSCISVSGLTKRWRDGRSWIDGRWRNIFRD